MREISRTRSWALAISLFACIAAGGASLARADVIQTYDFTGTLANDIEGDGTSVTGTFSLDLTNESISAYDFTAPGDTLQPTGFGHAQVFENTGTSPVGNFVNLVFYGASFSQIDLFFETTLSAFSGDTFYTGPITGTGLNGATSQYLCEGGPCETVGVEASNFTSGAATLVSTTGIPEPASAALLGGSLMALAATRRRKAG